MSKEQWIRHLDSLRHTYELAQEEYGSWLNAFEDEYGYKEREKYEEAHV